MIVYGLTPKGKRSRKPLSEGVMSSLSGSGSIERDTCEYSLETGGTMMAERRGQYLHPAPPLAMVKIGNDGHTVELSWKEVSEIYAFMSRKRENKLREEFNEKHNLSPF